MMRFISDAEISEASGWSVHRVQQELDKYLLERNWSMAMGYLAIILRKYLSLLMMITREINNELEKDKDGPQQ